MIGIVAIDHLDFRLSDRLNKHSNASMDGQHHCIRTVKEERSKLTSQNDHRNNVNASRRAVVLYNLEILLIFCPRIFTAKSYMMPLNHRSLARVQKNH